MEILLLWHRRVEKTSAAPANTSFNAEKGFCEIAKGDRNQYIFIIEALSKIVPPPKLRRIRI